jgi:carbon-monoxide dehydrogenase medium subunit
VKAPSFGYVKPRALGEVFDLLDQHGEEAKLLAGGQSLMPSLNLRLSSPAILIDLNAVPGLDGISETGASVVIGAMTRHVMLETSALLARHAPLVAAAMPHIAHPAIRNRGTIGGSLAFADPAAELPACMVALNASFVLQGRAGERRVAAASFFKGLFETDLRVGEILRAVEIPKAAADHRFAFDELARRHGDYAMVGLAAAAGTGWLNLVYFGVGDRPASLPKAAAALRGGDVEAAVAVLQAELDPPGDLNGGPETKRHLAGVLLRRAAPSLLKA